MLVTRTVIEKVTTRIRDLDLPSVVSQVIVWPSASCRIFTGIPTDIAKKEVDLIKFNLN